MIRRMPQLKNREPDDSARFESLTLRRPSWNEAGPGGNVTVVSSYATVKKWTNLTDWMEGIE